MKWQFSKNKIQMNNKQSLFLQSFSNLFCNVSLTLEVRSDIDSLFVVEHSTETYSLHFHHLWVSVWVTIHCKKKHLYWGLKDALVYMCIDINLEDSLTLSLFSKIVIVGWLLRPVISETFGAWADLHHQECVSSCGAGLKLSLKKLWITHNICANVGQMIKSYIQVITAVHSIHSFVRMFIYILPLSSSYNTLHYSKN